MDAAISRGTKRLWEEQDEYARLRVYRFDEKIDGCLRAGSTIEPVHQLVGTSRDLQNPGVVFESGALLAARVCSLPDP